MATPTNNRENYVLFALVAVVAIALVVYLLQPKKYEETQTANAVEEVHQPDGPVAREPDVTSTTNQKIGEAIQEVGQDVEKSTSH